MKILVYGGTGSQGGGVVRAALNAGHTPHVLTRHPERAGELKTLGAVIVPGDMADPDSLRAANADVDAVALLAPFSSGPAMPTLLANAIEAARTPNVKAVVFNASGTALRQRSGIPPMDARQDLIDHVMGSGLPVVTLQPTAYLENLLGPWTVRGIVEQNELAYPITEDTRIGWIATQDVGALIVAALERPHLAGQNIVVSGEENLTGAELAERLSQGLGRTITFRAQPLEEFGAAIGAVFGPEAGEGAIAGYRFQRENGHLMVMHTDMGPVLAQLPVVMTPVADWAAQFRQMLTAVPS